MENNYYGAWGFALVRTIIESTIFTAESTIISGIGQHFLGRLNEFLLAEYHQITEIPTRPFSRSSFFRIVKLQISL